MSAIVWDRVGERYYETGVSNGVLYKPNSNNEYVGGVAWNGLTSVSINPSGAEPNALYADDIKYLNLMSAEEIAATIEAYTYPDEFAECDGSVEAAAGVFIGQQKRKPFGLCFRTVHGNDVDGNDKGYKIHLIYGALASPAERSYESINDSPDAITFSWDVTTTPVEVGDNYKPIAYLVLDSLKVPAAKMTTIKNILYGTENTEPRMPLPDEIISTIGPSE